MKVYYTEPLIPDDTNPIVFYSNRPISRVFRAYIDDSSIREVRVIDYDGRKVTLAQKIPE
jgi:hypothetical protein